MGGTKENKLLTYKGVIDLPSRGQSINFYSRTEERMLVVVRPVVDKKEDFLGEGGSVGVAQVPVM